MLSDGTCFNWSYIIEINFLKSYKLNTAYVFTQILLKYYAVIVNVQHEGKPGTDVPSAYMLIT